MRSQLKGAETNQLRHILSRMPTSVANSFNPEQIEALSASLSSDSNHWLDMRPVVKVPLLPWTFYLVFLVGRNKRHLSAREQRVATQTLIGLIVTAIFVLSLTGILVLYLLKSALGIELIPGHHFGVWFWFEEVFLGK